MDSVGQENKKGRSARCLIKTLLIASLALHWVELASAGPLVEEPLAMASREDGQVAQTVAELEPAKAERLSRVRRHLSGMGLRRPSLGDQQQQVAVGQLEAEVEAEGARNHLLPDPIAQARQDKALERAFLQMVFTGLRSGLRNAAGQQQQLRGPQELFGRLARLEQLEQLEQLAEGSNQLEPYLAPSQMDKREYIKPCSFNAISCVRTPFRKV